MADDEPEEDEEGTPPPSKLPMIGGMVVMLILGLGGGYFAAGMMAEDAPPADEELVGEDGEPLELDEDGNPKEPEGPTRAIHNLGRFAVNLRGTSGGRVLRTEVQVEISSDDVEAITERTPLLRDTVLTLASDYSFGELEGLDGKMRLRDEILGRLNASLDGSPKVQRVYFTEFVVQ